MMYLEAAVAHKKAIKNWVGADTPGLFVKEEPLEGQLRAVRVVANDAAHKERFVLPNNMRVPEASVIFRLFGDGAARDGGGREDMSLWESQGKRQDGRAVAVEARRLADRVLAILQPVEPVRERPKPKRPESKSLFDE